MEKKIVEEHNKCYHHHLTQEGEKMVHLSKLLIHRRMRVIRLGHEQTLPRRPAGALHATPAADRTPPPPQGRRRSRSRRPPRRRRGMSRRRIPRRRARCICSRWRRPLSAAALRSGSSGRRRGTRSPPEPPETCARAAPL